MKTRLALLLRRDPGISPAAELGMDPGDPFPMTSPPRHADWVAAPPDLVITGAPDSGGEEMARLLTLHPSIHAVRPELRFWERHFEDWPSDSRLEEYRDWFARPVGLLSGELAPTTMSQFWAPRMLAAAAPEVRIVVMLRDPVARYLAGRGRLERYRPMARGWRYGPRGFTLWASERAFRAGEYGLQLGWLGDAIPRDRTLVVQTEAFLRTPQAILDRVAAFLGLEPVQVPGADSLVSLHDDPPPPIEAERLAAIRALYRPDVGRCRRLLPDLDLSLWPNYPDLDG